MMKKMSWMLALTAAAAVFLTSGPGAKETTFDVLIKGGRIIDGTGNPWFYGDVGLIGDRIAAVGRLEGMPARKTVEARGLIIAPGFIDLHTHCDSSFGREETRLNLNYLTQGVTTVVTGNCGYGPYPVRETVEAWEKSGMGTNAAILMGLGLVRAQVMGMETRAPKPEEMDKMKAMVREAMDDGAFGVSTGLQYIPGRYTTTEEIVDLTRVAAERGGLYSSHMRSEEEKLVEAVREIIRIGEESGARVNVSHFKASARPNWGRLQEAAGLIEEARARGLEVTADIYPYSKSATTTLETIFNIPRDMEPFAEIEKKMSEKGLGDADRKSLATKYMDELAAALADPARREKIKKLTVEGDPGSVNWVAKGGWLNFTIMDSRKNPSFIGKMFCDLAKELGREEFEIAADLYIQERDGLVISLSTMSEDDVRFGLSRPWTSISSDASAVTGSEEAVHPRSYGTFPRVLAKYAREDGLLTLEDAVRKMTTLPAQLLRLKDRGIIREGCAADLVLFDPAAVQDRATYLKPHQYSTGIVHVFVNGKPVIENGASNGSLNGKVLLAPSRKKG